MSAVAPQASVGSLKRTGDPLDRMPMRGGGGGGDPSDRMPARGGGDGGNGQDRGGKKDRDKEREERLAAMARPTAAASSAPV